MIRLRLSQASRTQRGEGQIGCVIMAVVFSIIGAAAFKAVPVLISNNNFKEAAVNIATRTSTTSVDELQKEIRAKAKEYGVAEAMEPGAVVLTKSGDKFQGTFRLKFNYTRKIDFYGLTTVEWVTDSSSEGKYMDAR